MPMTPGDVLMLPAGAARHVQVLRLQPGDSITLFHGGLGDPAGRPAQGGEFEATVLRMGRQDVEVQIGNHTPVEREAARAVHLAVGMPANDRMDWLVEKATELGVASIQPLVTERTVLRLSGERAGKKQSHWQSIAIAASEQCGRNQVPHIHAVDNFSSWIKTLAVHTPNASSSASRLLLSLRTSSSPLREALAADTSTSGAVLFLSGPEGGLSEAEELAALGCGFGAVSLGPRVLRAETAALAALTLLA